MKECLSFIISILLITITFSSDHYFLQKLKVIVCCRQEGRVMFMVKGIGLTLAISIVSIFTLAQFQQDKDLEKILSHYFSKTYYEGLADELVYYQSISHLEWEILAEKEYSFNDTGKYISILQQKLVLFKDLAEHDFKGGVLDSSTVRAIHAFQQRLAIDTAGFLNRETIAALNISPYQISQQIAENINRFIAHDSICDSVYILINIPEQMLRVIENEAAVLEMKVVVGKKSTPTPELSAFITKMVLNPEWNVPSSIVANEILPKLKKDPAYLKKHGMYAYKGSKSADSLVGAHAINFRHPQKYKIVQTAGSHNALGKIKFVIETNYDVYLHDTPEKSLFNKPHRAFSHGCIRLEKPFELASYISTYNKLDYDWNIETSATKAINLEKFIPVYVVYFNAWIQNGKLNLRPDLYNKNVNILN